MTTSDDMVTLVAQIPESELPLPGSWTQVKMSNGMVAQLWNLRRGESVARQPRSLGYVPVTVAVENRYAIHAAINRRRRNRNDPARYTLCDQNRRDNHIVESVVDGSLETMVTCHNCRKQLAEDGMIENVGDPIEWM